MLEVLNIAAGKKRMFKKAFKKTTALKIPV